MIVTQLQIPRLNDHAKQIQVQEEDVEFYAHYAYGRNENLDEDPICTEEREFE